jgi:hypothetical protein
LPAIGARRSLANILNTIRGLAVLGRQASAARRTRRALGAAAVDVGLLSILQSVRTPGAARVGPAVGIRTTAE